jgi:hypothetical protein
VSNFDVRDMEELYRIPGGDRYWEAWPTFSPDGKLAAVNVDRVQSDHPQLVVIVARRTDDSQNSLQVTQK